MKMDAEFPRFSQRLLEVVYPNYLAPTPAMAVVRFEPSMNEGTLARGFDLPRGTLLRGKVPRGEQTPAEFMTGHHLKLWPLRAVQASFGAPPPDLPLTRLGLAGRGTRVLSALRIRIEVCGGLRLEDLDLDQLVFYLNGQDLQMQRLLEIVIGNTVAVLGHDSARPVGWINRMPADAVRHEGFDDDQALLPADARVFQGYRLLQEYFAFPRRYLFFSVNGLKRGLRAARRRHAARNARLRPDAAVFRRGAGTGRHHHRRQPAAALRAGHQPVPQARRPRGRDGAHRRIPRSGGPHASAGLRNLRHDAGYRPRLGGPPGTGVPALPTAPSSADPDDYGAYYSMRREPRPDLRHARGATARAPAIQAARWYLSLVDRHEAPFSEQLAAPDPGYAVHQPRPGGAAARWARRPT